MKFHHLTAHLTALLLLGNSLPVSAEETVQQGTYHNVSWTLQTHVLTVTGTGEVYGAKGSGNVPDTLPDWLNFAEDIYAVVLDDGITGVQYRTFADLPNLQKVTLGADFEQFGVEAFCNDAQLSEIIGLEQVKYFDFRCLTGTAYTEANPFIIQDGILRYAEGTDLQIPDGVKEIAPFAFGNLTGFDSKSGKQFHAIPFYEITIPEGVEVIQSYAFAFSPHLQAVHIPESVQMIGEYAFFSCPHLEEVTICPDCKEIGAFAFYNCRNLDSLTVLAKPAGTQMGVYAFGYDADWETISSTRAEEKGIDLSEPKYASLLNYLNEADKVSLTRLDELADWAQIHLGSTHSYRELASGKAAEELYTDVMQNPDAVLSGYYNSHAETYALQNQIAFRPLDGYLLGDTDLNGKIDVLDVLTLNRALLDLEPLNQTQKRAADYNRDGAWDSIDSLQILRHVVHLKN